VLRVGLTGGIACGKSYARARMQDAGLVTLDLDLIAHEVMAPGGAAHADVLAEFGAGVRAPDGHIDRAALGARVFADPVARARLEELVHPRVRQEEEHRASVLAAAGTALLVTDAALLVEAGFHLRFDRLIVVHCPPEEQLRRLRLRDGLDEPAARARLRAQMPIAEKRSFAHFQIDTSGPFGQTDAAVDAVTASLQVLAAQPRRWPSLVRDRARAALALGPREGPRGLTPARLLAEIVATGGIEMARVARLLTPPLAPGEPWYRAALRPGAHRSESLAAPVALWSMARAGGDADYTVAAAASLARLTHADPPSVAGACLRALALCDALDPDDPPLDAARWRDRAARWGGAPATDSTVKESLDMAAEVRSPRGTAADDPPELTALGFA
jgi:dephospho-CoA kinase